MIKQPATVIKETDDFYLLESLPKSACPKCDRGEGCGGGLLAKAFSNKTYQLKLNKEKVLAINETVQVGIPSSLLVRASLIMYLLPLFSLVIGSIIFGSLNNYQDVATVSGAFVGFILGIFFARTLSMKLYSDGIASPILIREDTDSCWYQAD